MRRRESPGDHPRKVPDGGARGSGSSRFRGRKGLLLFGGLALVAVVAAGFVVARVFFINGAGGLDIHTPHQLLTGSGPPSETVPPTPEANTYRNGSFNYEFVVPSGWQVRDQNPKSVAVLLAERGFFVAVNVYGATDLPPAPATLAGYRDAWLTAMNDVMPAFAVVREERVGDGQDAALLYEYTWLDRGTGLRARALLMRRSDYGYEVFGWVPEPEWEEFLPAVDGLIRSFKPG